MLQNKYNIEFSKEVIIKNVGRLTNQLWKLIPMRENNENWQKQLKTVLIEIAGLASLFLDDARLLQLMAKLEGILKDEGAELDFNLYRKTVFESISLLQEIVKAYEQ